MENNVLLKALLDLELILSGRLLTETGRDQTDILSSDFREIGRSGHIWSREEILSAMKQEANRDPAEILNFELKNLTPDVVLVTYQSVRKDAKATEAKTNRSSIWRYDPDKQWRMVFHQGTPTSE